MRRNAEPHIPDPYAGRSVHGTLPLVVDVEDPCGVRFARLGHDMPGECLADPSGLPGAEWTVHAFPDSAARNVYVEALREHAGNAVRWTAPPGFTPLLLVARFDRSVPAGATTLSEAVRLVAHGGRAGPRPLAEAMAEARQDMLRAVERERAAAEARSRWAGAIAALRVIPGVGDVSPGRDGGEVLDFEVEVSGSIVGRHMAVWRTDAGHVVGGHTWGGGMLHRSPQPMAELARSDAAAGLVPGPNGMVGLPVAGTVDDGLVRRAVTALDAREGLVARLRADTFTR